MPVIDHTNTIALLIVASSFPNDPTIDPIPNVLANLQFLKQSLINPEIIGIPEANIMVSVDESRSQIEKKLRAIADKTKNKKFTLLLYYSGHGILSSEDFQLYLATHDTSKKDLEIDAVNIEDFRKYIRKSVAGRKIVILDCCHSGAIIGMMGDMSSKIQSELNVFEGTYVMTSAAEDTPSLFPEESPAQPTFFTGKLVNILNEGLDSDKEFCSLRDIYNEINSEFREKGLPLPQQSNFNNADQLNFSINRKFVIKKTADEAAWEETLEKNYKWTFIDFINQFPASTFAKEARKKINEIEENEIWNTASTRNTVSSLYYYLDCYPEGRFLNEANSRIKDLREKDDKKHKETELREESSWNESIQNNSVSSFEEYLKIYPFGKFAGKAKISVQKLKEKETELREEKLWNEAMQNNSVSFFEEYLKTYPSGKFGDKAKIAIQKLKEEEIQKIEKERKNAEELEEKSVWEKFEKENSTSAFTEYLRLYPLGKYKKDAEGRIKELNEIEIQKAHKEEKRVWNQALDENTVLSFENYLAAYPAGSFGKEAKNNIQLIKGKEKQNAEREKAAEEENLWEKLKIQHSKEAFIEYLKLYPSGKFTTEATKQLDVLNEIELQELRKVKEEKERQRLWNIAVQQKSISSYEEFLKIYPQGRFSEEARNNIRTFKDEQEQQNKRERLKEEQTWEETKKKNSAESYNKYLQIYPSGKFSDTAKSQLSLLNELVLKKIQQKREENEREVLWKEVVKENTIASYGTFLNTYPEGKQSEKAKNAIELLKQQEKTAEEENFWETVKKKNAKESFREYLNLYPYGKHCKAAKDEIDIFNKTEKEKIRKDLEERNRDKLWNETIDKNTIAAYEKYLKTYPDQRFSEEAKNNILIIKEKEKQNSGGQEAKKEKNLLENLLSNKWIIVSIISILFLTTVLIFRSGKPNSASLVPDLTLQSRIDIANSIYNNLVKVPGGTFTMGLNNTQYESPAHSATVKSFLLSKYEVTREQWNAVMGDKKYKSSFNLPATNISWMDAQTFINKLNTLSGKKYRLPDESEWEYACLAGDEEKYKGNENDYSWNSNNSDGILHGVGRKLPNKIGIYDMLGNAYEWCNDTYSKYNNIPEDNLIKIIRGGDYKHGLDFISPKIRKMEKSTNSGEGIGFRLTMDL